MPHSTAKHFRHVKFLPYVGPNYADSSQRVLLLGIKFHSIDPAAISENSAFDCVDLYLNHDDNYVESFFDTYDRAIDTVRAENESRREAWERIVFYNYTQVVMLMPNAMPPQSQIDKDDAPFAEVLLKYKPNKVVVWGKSLYDKILYNYGQSAQNFDNHQSWMLDINELPNAGREEPLTIHVSYINDPSHVDFNARQQRKIAQAFLKNEAAPFRDPQIKRQIIKIFNFLRILDGDKYSTSRNYSFIDILAKGVVSGVLHFTQENGIPEIQRLRAENVVATAHFATLVREKLRFRPEQLPSIHEQNAVTAELFNPDKFEILFDETDGTIKFHANKKNRAKLMYERLSSIHSRYNEGKKVAWKDLEAIFGIKNLRQYVRDISENKEYYKSINTFFRRYE